MAPRRRRPRWLSTREDAEGAVRRYSPDRAAAMVGEPQGAVRADRDSLRAADTPALIDRDCTTGRDPANRVPGRIGEPQRAVRSGCDSPRMVDARLGIDAE